MSMLPDTVVSVLTHREVLIAGLVLAVTLLVWLGRRVRKLATSERPDDALSNLVMVIGLGWSSEAVWEISRHRLHFSLGLTLLLFFVFEALLSLAMIRAKRHMRDFGWPGRFGTTAWTIGACMALVAMVASHSIPEAVLRMLIPLLLVKQWWDGLVGGASKRPADASTWRWTPRRLLLALGAIEPGERDVHTVHRERLVQQMTTLYHRYNHGSRRFKSRRAARLARLSLTADDAIIAEVQRRGDRALWFHQNRPQNPPITAIPALTTPPLPVPVDVPPVAVDSHPVNPASAVPETTASVRSSESPLDMPIPTPDVVATRVTKPAATSPAKPGATPRATALSTGPRPSNPATAASHLARPATDTPVTEPDAAQLKLPIVSPDLLRRADQMARQYRTEHGEPIKAGQLAARLRVNSETATEALALLSQAPNNATTPIPAVNGNRPNTTTR
ncbi:hypothetical protein [Actinoplanes regularis]|uniref:hypothetical protein n=1 Tax=Actinoplanes regularis TaxID=52697 RepID=UPI0024A4F6E3|nr:hypothetical protein [Actinoplanes regularis]GLW31888.1 hypothetical protein Areg01_48270 [Actinoplanes regularis]